MRGRNDCEGQSGTSVGTPVFTFQEGNFKLAGRWSRDCASYTWCRSRGDAGGASSQSVPILRVGAELKTTCPKAALSRVSLSQVWFKSPVPSSKDLSLSVSMFRGPPRDENCVVVRYYRVKTAKWNLDTCSVCQKWRNQSEMIEISAP